MPAAPRPPRPTSLRPPRPPEFGRLRLAPARSLKSLELDNDFRQAPYKRWDEFRSLVKPRDGEHITVVGKTGSGKTVLLRELVVRKWWVVVLGTKNEDKELYAPFEDHGFEIVDKFDPSPKRPESRVIFRPRLRSPDEAAVRRQGEQFRRMLIEVWEYGGWTVVIDELAYVSRRLGLGDVLDTLWEQGRSLHVTVAAATQQPVRVPTLAWDQATHLFLFRESDRRRIDRMSEFAGADSQLLKRLIPQLPRHEFLYVDTRDGSMYRSKVLV